MFSPLSHIGISPGSILARIAIFSGLFWAWQVLAMTPADSAERVRIIHAKACNLMYSAPDSAVRLADELLDFAGSGCPLEQADAHYIKGLYLVFQGRFADVHIVADKIASIAYVHDQPVQDKAHLLHGIAYSHQHQPAKALESLGLALNHAIIAQNGAIEAAVLNEVGETMRSQQQYQTAMKYFQLAAEEAKKCDAQRTLAQALHNIGTIHAQNGDPSLALNFALQGLRLRREINANSDLSSSFALVVRVFLIRKDYNNAEKYIAHAIRQDSLYRFGPSLAELYALKGEILEYKKQKTGAIACYQRAASTAGWCNNELLQAHCFARLAELYKGQQEYQQQYERLRADLKNTQPQLLDAATLVSADTRLMQMLGVPNEVQQARENNGSGKHSARTEARQ